ncbi:hypothetical protein L7H23_00815 [Sphingopyxis sp. BSN-002]|uniref:hypothetical protein n=1 Tax=Sphingopyxis sp. BSN-002 TaxID=2911495 RepID=UPI001EDA5A35|nr:hypothetical protein [Sphingopyxis sp. BSN-002]UKK84677.1 hypothetical protein L7H23_00815 [Sphingopyxis sp. BSN-002]
MQNTARLATSALVATFALSACAATGQQTPIRDGSDVALGQRAMVDGPIVQPVKVLEDSRCPMNARCIWAGRVRLQMVWIRGNGEKQPFEVTLGESTPLADGAIRLESVRPGKRTDVTLKPSDYRFSFRFDGGL